MDRFITRENIKRYRKLASEATDSTERSRIMKLLADEEAKLALMRSGNALEARSPDNATTEYRGGHDGEEQRSGG
jgi:hypothetical protein